MANFRLITDQILRADGSVVSEAVVKFYLLAPSADPNRVVITDLIRVYTDTNGEFEVPLFCGADAVLPANYRVILPNDVEYDFALSYGTGTPVRLSQLLTGGAPLAAGDPLYILLDVHEATVASASQLGHVKIGTGLQIDADGTLSAARGGSGSDRSLERRAATITTPILAPGAVHSGVVELGSAFSLLSVSLASSQTRARIILYKNSEARASDSVTLAADFQLRYFPINQGVLFDSYDYLNNPSYGAPVSSLDVRDIGFNAESTPSSQIPFRVVNIGESAEVITVEIEYIAEALAGQDSPAGTASPAAWGSITGSLADQTDLQATLDEKAASSHTHAYADLTGKPALFDGDYNALTNKPILFDNNYNSLANRPSLGTAAALNAPEPGSNAAAGELVRGDDTRLTSGAGSAAADQPAAWGSITGTLNTQTDLQSALDEKALASHAHTIANVTNLQNALDGKAASSHSHQIADVANLQASLDGKAAAAHNHQIADVTNLQTALDTKAASTHSHAINDVANLQTALNNKAPTNHTHAYVDLSGKPTLGTAAALNAPSAGANANATELVRGDDTRLGTGTRVTPAWGGISGTLADQTDLNTALSGKAAASHNHQISEVANLQTALDSKAAGSHSHTIANVTSLQTALDSKAASSHNHAINDVSGLQTALDGKAAALHTHSYNDLTDKPTVFNGDYNSLSNKPALGSASARDVPASGNAVANQVVLGSDTRLSGSGAKTINQQFRTFTDCLGTTNTNEWVHTQSAAGILVQTGPGTGIGGAGGRRTAGCIYFSFPTAASANASIGGANTNSLCTGGGEMRFQARVFPAQESSANCTFTTVCGLSNDRTSTTPTDGVFFRYTNVNANWVAVCRAGGVETAVNTGSAYLSTNDFQLLEIVINANATQAVFRINGNTVATITTNVPQYGSATVNPTIGSIKTAGSSQGYPIYIDFIETTIDFATAR